MSSSNEFGNPLRKFKLVFLGEQSGESKIEILTAIMPVAVRIQSILEQSVSHTLTKLTISGYLNLP